LARASEYDMSIAKVIEIKSASKNGLEDAIKTGLSKAAKSLDNVSGAWINGIKVSTDSKGRVTEWNVDMKVTFVLK
jgi:flavin-binding protein dodecin